MTSHPNPAPAPIAWSATPLFLPLLAFITGIYVAYLQGFPPENVYPPVIGGLLVGGVGCRALRGRFLWLRWVDVSLLLIAFVMLGGWRAGDLHRPNSEAFFTDHAQVETVIGGRVAATRTGKKTVRLETLVEYLDGDSLRRTVEGKVLVYLPLDSTAESVKIGDRIAFRSRIDSLGPPLNPGVFDAKSYWATQGIYHRTFVREDADWRHLPGGNTSLRAVAERVRLAWFASFLPYLGGDELAVAVALVMGKKDLLNQEIRSAYKDTGALHVLAVSGLHVGIIFLIIKSLLIQLPGRNTVVGRWLETVLTVTVVWAFAFVSGLSPSVERAAIMFTIIALGRVVRRQTYLTNTLAAAALLMLWFEPLQLFQVGFQLSFCALLGIVWFSGAVQKALPGRGAVLTAVKGGVAASIGAQLGTLPVSLYVFRAFPIYFAVSGSAVVLFAYVAMFVGVLHGALFAVFGPGWWVDLSGRSLAEVVGAQNTFIRFFSALPAGVVTLPKFPFWLACGLAVSVVGLAYSIRRRRWRGGAALILLAVLTIIIARPQVQSWESKRASITLYHVNGKTLIDYLSPQHQLSFGDELSADDLHYNVLPNRQEFGVDSVNFTSINAVQHFRLGDESFAVLNDESFRQEAFDYLLVRQKARPKFICGRPLPPSFTIVLDGSVPAYRRKEWKAFAEENQLSIWITAERGALVLNL